jgi:hypothetical protein
MATLPYPAVSKALLTQGISWLAAAPSFNVRSVTSGCSWLMSEGSD